MKLGTHIMPLEQRWKQKTENEYPKWHAPRNVKGGGVSSSLHTINIVLQF